MSTTLSKLTTDEAYLWVFLGLRRCSAILRFSICGRPVGKVFVVTSS